MTRNKLREHDSIDDKHKDDVNHIGIKIREEEEIKEEHTFDNKE